MDVDGAETGIHRATIGPTTKGGEWEVQYATFFNFPPSLPSSTAAASSSLRPMLPSKKLRLKGTWLRSSSSNAIVRIFSPHHSLLQSTLVVSLRETIYEEHYVSQLNFTWPQVSGHSDGHVRGSRVIFASYRDSMDQIQKFAMRFSSSAEAQTFMESSKWLLEQVKVGCSDGMSSTVVHYGIVEEANHANPSLGCSLHQQPSVKLEHPYSCSQHAMLNHSEVLDFTLPPSFTALLSDCCTETEPGLAQGPAEPDLNHFLKAGRIADYSFIEKLDKIDSIITFLGGNLAL